MLRVGTDTGWLDLSFTVSPNPDEDFISLEPITVSTDKPRLHKRAEKLQITGTAQRVQQGDEGLDGPYRVVIPIDSGKFPRYTFRLYASDTDRLVAGEALHIHRLKSVDAFLDNGGNFKAVIDLPPTVFQAGTYRVSAVYQGQRAQNYI